MSRVALKYLYKDNKINPYLLKKDFPVFQEKANGRELYLSG